MSLDRGCEEQGTKAKTQEPHGKWLPGSRSAGGDAPGNADAAGTAAGNATVSGSAAAIAIKGGGGSGGDGSGVLVARVALLPVRIDTSPPPPATLLSRALRFQLTANDAASLIVGRVG